MNFSKKHQSFAKAPLIGILVALIMCVGLSVQVMANPVPVQVVDDSDSSIIEANPGDAVDIYIRLDNVEEYYEDLSGYDPPFDPADPGDAEALEKLKHQIQAIQFVFTYDPSALEINEDADGNPIVEAFGVTAGSGDPLLEAWPVYAKIVKDVDGNPIGKLNVCLSMNPVDPSDPNWSKDLYDDPDANPDLTWNPSEIYSLRESGKVLKISATVDESAAGCNYELSLVELQDVDGNSLAILNEKDKDTGEDIIPSEIVPGTLCVGDVIPPTVISKSPDDGDTDVPVDTNITVGFSEPMDTGSTESAFSVEKQDDGTPVEGTISWSDGDATLTFDPTDDLLPSTPYAVTITDSATDVAGNPLQDTPVEWSFTTAAVCSIPWTYTPTPTICDFYGVAEIAEGVPADPGDVVGAFVSDVVVNDGCVGIFELLDVPGNPGVYGKIHVYGDDPFTPEKDGAVDGDTIIFRILDRSECEVYETVVVTGDPTWQSGVTKEVDLRAITKVIFELHLAESWNLISWPVGLCFYQGDEPAEPLPDGTETINISTLGYDAMQDWFTSVIIPNNDIGEVPWRAVTGAKPGGLAVSMDSDLPPFLNDLEYMSAGYGYWVKMKDGTGGGTITFEGSLLAPDATLSLAESWNLVGFLPTTGYYDTSIPGDSLLYAPEGICGWIQKPEPVYDYVLSSIAGKWRAVTGARPGGLAISADSTLPPFLNDLRDFSPGYGYWIKMYEAGDLSYPSDSCPASEGALAAMSPSMYDVPSNGLSVKPTNRSMFVYGMVSLDGNPAPVGSNITVWNSNGALVGKGTVKRPGIYGLFPIYGDDFTTGEVDGALIDEELTVKVDGYSTSTTIRWLGDREFRRIDLASQTRTIPSVSWLGQNYPNPFNPETWLPYALSESAKVAIQIYDVHGGLVQTLNLGEKTAGVYDTKELAAYWNGRNYAGERVSSGLYFYKLTAGRFTQVKRMVILK